MKELQIRVKSLGYKEEIVQANENETVEMFQKKLQNLFGIMTEKQRIMLTQEPDLMPGHRLKEYPCLYTDNFVILAMQLPEQLSEAPPNEYWKSLWKPFVKPRGKAKVRTRQVKKFITAAPPGFALPQQHRGVAVRDEGKAQESAAESRESASLRAVSECRETGLRSPVPPSRPLQRSASSDNASLVATRAAKEAEELAGGPLLPRSASAASTAASTGNASARGQASPAAQRAPARTGAGKALTKGSTKSPPQAPGAAQASSAQRSRPAPNQLSSLSWSPPIAGASVPGASTPKGASSSEAVPPATARLGAPPTAPPGAPTMNLSSLVPPATTKGSSPPNSSRGSGNNVTSAMNVAGVTRIRRTDLQRIGRLGVGAFGLVTLEADRRTGRTYALKAVSKGYLAHLRMEYSVLNEKRILKMLDTPFVVRLLATYNGREHVYFLLEAALGGELFTTYERLKLYGSEVHAKFYVACVTEALAHLHARNVIYRDLKPENLLLDVRGFCKVTDMGLAKITTGQTFTMVGTPDYMAPEVIDQTGHTRSVDWWTLGVLLFELMAGKAPFESKTGNAHETYSLVKKGIETVRFPDSLRPEATHLVRQLCHRNPEARLRVPKLREHNFFRNFDWAGLVALRLNPPLVPQVRGPRDLTNFRDCEHEDPQAMPYQDTGSQWDLGFEDDELSVGAAAAAVQAPMLPMPGNSSSRSAPAQGSPTSNGYRHMAMSANGGVQVQHQHQQQQQQPQQRRAGSPPCSPRTLQARQVTSSTARLGTAQAPNSARGWTQGHSERKMGTGSFVPPIARSASNMQSPPSSPNLGGC